jgi:hypothetical protein
LRRQLKRFSCRAKAFAFIQSLKKIKKSFFMFDAQTLPDSAVRPRCQADDAPISGIQSSF